MVGGTKLDFELFVRLKVNEARDLVKIGKVAGETSNSCPCYNTYLLKSNWQLSDWKNALFNKVCLSSFFWLLRARNHQQHVVLISL
jgi:hypothetical protein